MIFNRQVASPAKNGASVRQFSSPLQNSSSAGDLLSPTSLLIKEAKTSQSFKPNAEWAARVRKKIGDSLIRAKWAPDYLQQIAALGVKLEESKGNERKFKLELEEHLDKTARQTVENSDLLKSMESLKKKFQSTSEKLESVEANYAKDIERLYRLTASQRELISERDALLCKQESAKPTSVFLDVEEGAAAHQIERLKKELELKDAELGKSTGTINELEAKISVTNKALREANADLLRNESDHRLEMEELTNERDAVKQSFEKTTADLRKVELKVTGLEEGNQALLSIIQSLGLGEEDLTGLVRQQGFPSSLKDKLFGSSSEAITPNVGARNSELRVAPIVSMAPGYTSANSGRGNGGRHRLGGGSSKVQYD